MSLIAVAQHVRGPRTFTRALLVMIAVTVGIIAGLLAMHSLNTHPTATGHGETVAIDTTAAAAADGRQQATSTKQGSIIPSETTECADCGDEHGMAWMVCILALLVAVLLLTRPGLRWRSTRARGDLRPARPRWPARAHALPPPPSLSVLCISRT